MVMQVGLSGRKTDFPSKKLSKKKSKKQINSTMPLLNSKSACKKLMTVLIDNTKRTILVLNKK